MNAPDGVVLTDAQELSVTVAGYGHDVLVMRTNWRRKKRKREEFEEAPEAPPPGAASSSSAWTGGVTPVMQRPAAAAPPTPIAPEAEAGGVTPEEPSLRRMLRKRPRIPRERLQLPGRPGTVLEQPPFLQKSLAALEELKAAQQLHYSTGHHNLGVE